MNHLFKLTGFCCLLFTAAALYAQVAIELTIPRTTYLEYERIFARVRMRNYSGQPLVFGRDSRLSGKLLFDVSLNGKRIEPVSADSYPMTGTILQPGETKEIMLLLSQYYKLNKPGKYTVHAYVTHQQLPNDYKSQDSHFEVSQGVKAWSRTVGIPELLSSAVNGPRDQIEERTYEIRTITNNSDRLYYLVVEDRKHIYAVLPVGRMIGMEKYRAEVDMLSRLHLLVPTAPKLFRYYVVGLDGKIEESKMFKTHKNTPQLFRNPENGSVIVVGGAPALPGVDYLEQKPAE